VKLLYSPTAAKEMYIPRTANMLPLLVRLATKNQGAATRQKTQNGDNRVTTWFKVIHKRYGVQQVK
jgi:hypothetical protein